MKKIYEYQRKKLNQTFIRRYKFISFGYSIKETNLFW